MNVGRITPAGSGFAVLELAGRDPLVCSERVSLFAGLAVSETTGVGVGAVSESNRPDLRVCAGLGLFRRSAASAPAIRISSSVGTSDLGFLPRDLGLAGVADSVGVCSGGGAACLGASGFVSRATITSCACIGPAKTTLQSSTVKSHFDIKRRNKQLRPVRKPPFTRPFPA
jgi:hypothetical protein